MGVSKTEAATHRTGFSPSPSPLPSPDSCLHGSPRNGRGPLLNAGPPPAFFGAPHHPLGEPPVNPTPISMSWRHPPRHSVALPSAARPSLTGTPASTAAVPHRFPSPFVRVSAGPSGARGSVSLECATSRVQLQMGHFQRAAPCAASRRTRVCTSCFTGSGLKSCDKTGDSLPGPAALRQLNPPPSANSRLSKAFYCGLSKG